MRGPRVGVALFLLLSIVAIPSRSHAQERAATAPDTLRVWQSLWSMTGFGYEYGLEKGDVGMSGSNVKKLLAADPTALREVATFGRHQVPSFFGTLAAAVMLGAGLARNDDALTAAGAGVLGISFVIDQIGYRHLKKAARMHNQSRP
jgi:hypothetical protein